MLASAQAQDVNVCLGRDVALFLEISPFSFIFLLGTQRSKIIFEANDHVLTPVMRKME